MTGLGPWESPQGTRGRLLCASASLLDFLQSLLQSGILFYVGSSGRRIFLPVLLLLASRVCLCWGLGRSSTRLALGVHAGAVDREQVVSFTFLLTHLASAAVELGAGGEVGASDGMIAVAM